jgi:hypothetical protein
MKRVRERSERGSGFFAWQPRRLACGAGPGSRPRKAKKLTEENTEDAGFNYGSRPTKDYERHRSRIGKAPIVAYEKITKTGLKHASLHAGKRRNLAYEKQRI